MEVIYLLIPLAILLVAAMAVLLIWSIRSGQFDDLEGPAYRILMDDDAPQRDQDDDTPPSGTGEEGGKRS